MTLTFKSGLAVSTLAVLMAFPSTSLAQDVTFDFGGRYMLDYTVADLSNPDSEIRDDSLVPFMSAPPLQMPLAFHAA